MTEMSNLVNLFHQFWPVVPGIRQPTPSLLCGNWLPGQVIFRCVSHSSLMPQPANLFSEIYNIYERLPINSLWWTQRQQIDTQSSKKSGDRWRSNGSHFLVALKQSQFEWMLQSVLSYLLWGVECKLSCKCPYTILHILSKAHRGWTNWLIGLRCWNNSRKRSQHPKRQLNFLRIVDLHFTCCV